MKAYLIDPKARTFTEVVHDESLVALHRLLDCSQLVIVPRTVGLNKNDALYVDEEPYLRGRTMESHGAFMFKGLAQPLVGRGLVSGHTVDGDMCDPRTSLKAIKRLVVIL